MITPTPITYDYVLQLARQLPTFDQQRLLKQIQTDEQTQLERYCQEALELGQDPNIVQQVREGKVHPAMIAYGLLQDEPAFEHLTEEVYQNRQRPSTRCEPLQNGLQRR